MTTEIPLSQNEIVLQQNEAFKTWSAAEQAKSAQVFYDSLSYNFSTVLNTPQAIPSFANFLASAKKYGIMAS